MIERLEEGGSDLNKFESNAVYRAQSVWFDINLVVSKLALSIFQEQIGGIMGFTFFLASLSYILEA